MTERLSREHPRDCPHGRQWGKCDTCDLLEAQGHIAALEAEVARLRATLAAKEESQRANEDEMDAEIARLKGLACVDYWGCPIPGMTEANDGLRAENERLRACLPDEWCVIEILAEWLRSHGYDGLLSDDCACGLGGDFPACGEMPTDDCRPAYEHPCIPEDCGLSCITGSADFCMRTEKPAAQEATDAE